MVNPSAGLDAEASSQVDFESMKLRSGASLQIQNLNKADQKYNLRFIGAIKGKSILLTLPIVDGQPVRMPKGQGFVVRGFNGQYAYAFTSHVIQARARPFSYFHISYPLSVESKIVRKALRVNLELPASVIGGSEEIPVIMLDLSAKGSMIDSPKSIGEISDVIDVEFDVEFEGIKTKLTLPAKIKNAHYSKDATSIHVGVEFENIAQNEILILNSFILATTTIV